MDTETKETRVNAFTHLHIWYATKIAFKVISNKQAEEEE